MQVRKQGQGGRVGYEERIKKNEVKGKVVERLSLIAIREYFFLLASISFFCKAHPFLLD